MAFLILTLTKPSDGLPYLHLWKDRIHYFAIAATGYVGDLDQLFFSSAESRRVGEREDFIVRSKDEIIFTV